MSYFGNNNIFTDQESSWCATGEIDANGNPVYEPRPQYPQAPYETAPQSDAKPACLTCGGDGLRRESGTGFTFLGSARSYPCPTCRNPDGSKKL